MVGLDLIQYLVSKFSAIDRGEVRIEPISVVETGSNRGHSVLFVQESVKVPFIVTRKASSRKQDRDDE
jgi:hypothetical protein